VVENHKAPLVTARLGLRGGAWTEEKPGTASMALGMLTKGSAKHSEGELADELETYAISLSGGAGMDDSSVYLSALTEQAERAVGLMAEVVRTPTFPQEEFEKLRRQVVTSLTIATNEPSYIADRELRKRLYGEHPYARTEAGEIADVNALSVDDVRDWWQRFARPDQATLIFAGDIDPARAKALTEAAFGDWKAEGPAPQIALPEIPKPAATHIYLVDRPGVQSQIRVGQLGITRKDPGYFVSRVVNGYFGESFGSRVNNTIRVEKGATYGARGGYDAQRMTGKFVVGTFTKTERTAETVQTIFDEIKRLRDEPPSADELQTTKSYTLGRFPGDRETPQAVAADLWLIQSQDLPADYLEQLLKGVAATTAEDCTRLVRETVDPGKMVVVVVGPADELKADLEKIAPLTVVEANPPERVE
jgi:zinc protease